MMEEPIGARVFFWPTPVILAAVHDLVELQKGDVTFVEKSSGKISFIVEMHGFMWEYRFTVEDSGGGRSLVTLAVGGRDAKDPAVKIARQLALLEAILPRDSETDSSVARPPK